MIRPPLLQWATEYSHFTITQVILTMAKSSELTSHRRTIIKFKTDMKMGHL
jgi:hypothetical protein